MMEQRRVLTIPFAVDKDNMVENPLRIPMTCRSSDCGKLDGQVPWTVFSGYKFRSCNSHKNGSVMFDPATMMNLEVTRRKPLLILTDVLKTDLGKAYMERKRNSGPMSHREQLTDPQGESSCCQEEPPLTCRETRSSHKETRNNRSKPVTPKSSQRTTPPSSSHRSRLTRNSQHLKEKDDEESEDIQELILGKDSDEDERFAEVVASQIVCLSPPDCGLSLSWEHTKDEGGCKEFSPDSIKDRLSDPDKDVKHSLQKRKRSVPECNGRNSPKRHRESVLRFTVDDKGAGGLTPTSVLQEEQEGDVDMENLDRCIVQFTVGEEDRLETQAPVGSPSFEAGDVISNQSQSLLSREDIATQTSPAEPIVLSSDDEENGVKSGHCRERAPLEGRVTQENPSQEIVPTQQGALDFEIIQSLKVGVTGACSSVPVPPDEPVDYSCISVAFCTLHYGGYQGRANGGLMIAKTQIIFPVKDSKKQLNAILSFERKDLRKYSVWEQEELEERGVCFEDEEPPPAAVLLFCVSEAAAEEMRRAVQQLFKDDGATNTGKASPFILLTLRDPLVGMEGALLRSVLELDCMNNLTSEQNLEASGDDSSSSLGGLSTPFLSLDESIELIERTGLDPHLLTMLSVKSTDSEHYFRQDSPHSEVDEIPTAHIWVDQELEKESDVEPEMASEEDAESQLEPKEDQTEEQPASSSETLRVTTSDELLPESRKKEVTPVYTLFRHRTRGSYSVTLGKPASNWVKYKHQGLARRLIQFPPPPLKGGITVTMEDLQCLDSGQYLNDVIIDFYLKYLLQNASAAMAERSHIFSSFFYKQLTRRDNASEGGSSDATPTCQRQRRHQRVKTWTRHVDIFNKDFLFVPVNQEAHWYLVVICFPGLDQPKFEDWIQGSEAEDEKAPNGDDATPSVLKRRDGADTETVKTQEETTKDSPLRPVSCTEQTCKRKTVWKRPCILIMDSLKLSLHERVFKLLREYLQSEWEVRRSSSRDFGPDQMKSSHCRVPLQDNSSDCGLYLLQYVECFLKDPVVHFDLPLHLQQWFPRQQVRRKRDEIRNLILNLYRHQKLDDEYTE
ncbi:sentrin-specific protease 7 isoform 1-T2 [Menidia menidia]